MNTWHCKHRGAWWILAAVISKKLENTRLGMLYWVSTSSVCPSLFYNSIKAIWAHLRFLNLNNIELGWVRISYRSLFSMNRASPIYELWELLLLVRNRLQMWNTLDISHFVVMWFSTPAQLRWIDDAKYVMVVQPLPLISIAMILFFSLAGST